MIVMASHTTPAKAGAQPRTACNWAPAFAGVVSQYGVAA